MTVAAMTDMSAARRAMIDSQLRVSGVNQEAVLAAMDQVAREQFVPPEARGHAYIDRAIRLDAGHSLPAPLVQGLILAKGAPQPGERVLVVSCGSNYLPALVEAMGASVEVASAAEAAAGKPGSVGFTLMLVDGAVEHLPAALIAALAEGGRVVTGLVQRGVTSLASGTRAGASLELVPFADIGIPVLAEFAAPKSWSF
ncbi:MAG: protein-L-isoaspartate O-methyltransferase [Sphingomonadaceae bacterium]|jgi:protein-L-isoaspartate(D-aspartate) O-methyltransferase